jgi:ABC-type lipoprotein release transport system permease subunit
MQKYEWEEYESDNKEHDDNLNIIDNIMFLIIILIIVSSATLLII